jgi:hypothetical protein
VGWDLYRSGIQRAAASAFWVASVFSVRWLADATSASSSGAALPVTASIPEIVAVFTHLSDHAVVYGARHSDLFEMDVSVVVLLNAVAIVGGGLRPR